jgi:LmbE family N-acetylglucosaminyl deacetylase
MSQPTSPDSSLLVFGAHPDDIEFACGGILAQATSSGIPVHLVVCSRGEAGTHGTPDIRSAESARSAEILRATLEFVELDGDAHFEVRAAHAILLAEVIRRFRPRTILAPSLAENQHPDHFRLGRIVRDAARLARYGGLMELLHLPRHAVSQLYYYALSPSAEPGDITPVLIDVSSPEVLADWTAAMEAHASQVSARNYIELQFARARFHGLQAGVEYAVPLYPNDPLVFNSLVELNRGANRF